MSKKLMFVFAIVIMASFVLGACGAKTTTTGTTTGEQYKICEVTDMGGIDDKSFNATAWKGVSDAVDQLGVEGVYLESRQETDYANNINAFLTQDCDLIIGVGYALQTGIGDAAAQNPEQKFAGIDFAYDPEIANVVTSTYNIDQATFLAGYLAAGITETGIVATYGGMQFPSVTAFMDGFVLGVAKYNEVHGTDVQVLGWDIASQTGTFSGDFSTTSLGKDVTMGFIDAGADIIMPVAGPVGVGTIEAIHERGDTALMIGVDTDWSAFYPDDAEIILASAMKRMDQWIVNVVASIIDGTFAGGNQVATLDNGLIGIVYGSAWIDQIPADLMTELDALKADIIAGTQATLP